MISFRGKSLPVDSGRKALGHVVGLSSLLGKNAASLPNSTMAGPQITTAAAGIGSSGMGGNVSIGGLATGVNLDPMLWDVLPETMDQAAFPLELMRIYRDIYFYDSVAGATIDLLSGLPFSDWTLTGMDENKLAPYQESLERLNIEQALPEIAIDYLVQGAYVGQMVFNPKRKLFTDLVSMQPECCEFIQMPLRGQAPIINYKLPDYVKKFVGYKSKRVTNTLERMGSMGKAFKTGRFELNPMTSLFVARGSLSGRLGNSYLKRILPIYLVEKNLWKGTMIEATRRIRSILHLQAGDTDWEASPEEIEQLASLFIAADADPLGAVVGTRNAVSVGDVRPGGDFWNIFNIWGDTVPAKLRALGIGEAFLSGDASYNSLETSLSVFVDGLRSFRNVITNATLYNTIFPMISLAHGNLKKGMKMPAEILAARKNKVDSEDILHALQDTRVLETPKLVWSKTLEPKGDQQYFDMLEKMEEKGVPVPIRAWAAAGGYDLDKDEQSFDSDVEMRVKVAKFKKKLQDALAKVDPAAANPAEDEGSYKGEFSSGRGVSRVQHTSVNRKSIMGRDYGELHDLRQLGKTGKWRPIRDQRAAHAKMNKKLAKALAAIDQKNVDRIRAQGDGRSKSGNKH